MLAFLNIYSKLIRYLKVLFIVCFACKWCPAEGVKISGVYYGLSVQLIGAFVFATKIEQSLFFLNSNFQTPSHIMLFNSVVCVSPVIRSFVRRPQRLVSSPPKQDELFGWGKRCIRFRSDQDWFPWQQLALIGL